jgi:3-methylcrotonyl-CoA carboxylase alpha subunit
MFASVLIANRGEIACRVIRTARRLGVRTIAVYSDPDAYALHVRMADEAIRVGGASARESYLDVDAILEAARRSCAQAIHPGYGFLSENADFAAACEAAGFVFVGPPPDAIRAMGSKIGAKQLMERAGVPIVPGYHGDVQDDATLVRAAGEVGYPILIKASAGGGGKGMRIVRSGDELLAALAGARREASKAFGDDRLLLERYLVEPRHIEMQVFADRHGQCIHLHERDCSIQRRHQKIIEEGPAPGMSAERRAAMGEAAVRAARSVGYVGAGTVEFIASGDDFYFMEMNTRLQVEHPVTEMVTGIDLVEWQLRVAAGESLPIAQQDVPLRGHAFEARLYAEDPTRDFVPSTGVIGHLRWPETDTVVRIDTGVTEGDEISIHYDPMIAKLIAWGADRRAALAQLQRSLAGCEIVGVTTNLALLQRIATHADFAAGRVHTGFIAEHEQDLLYADDTVRDRLLAVAIAGWLQRHQRDSRESPWAATDGWRPNLPHGTELHFLDGEKRLPVVATPVADGWRITVDGSPLTVSARFDGDGRIDARVNGEKVQASWLERPGSIAAIVGGNTVRLEWDDHLRDGEGESHVGGLRSPMPGQVLQVLTRAGDKVRRGQPLMIVEAMKMEHTIVAPSDGTVESIDYGPGDRVTEGAQLLRLNAEPT